MQEEERETARVDSTDTITTTPYFGPGNTQDEALLRPVVWVRQTEDRIINDKEVGKDREIYEPTIYPAAYVIKTVGIGSTEIYVDNIRPFFDPDNESGISLNFQDKVAFIGQENKVTYIDICAHKTVDEKIIKSLRSKINLATQILGEDYKQWLV